MKHRSITAAAALVAAFASDAATVKSNSVAGFINVTDARQYVPLAVPFTADGEADKAFGELVLPDGIQEGDRLVAYSADESRHKALTFYGGEWKGVAAAAEGESDLAAGDPKAPSGLRPGDAFWLVRAKADEAVRLAGIVPSGGYGEKTVEGESELLASPRTGGFKVNAEGAIEGAAEGDMIVIPRDGADTRYTYGTEGGKSGWYEMAVTTETMTFTDANGKERTVTVNKREKRLVADPIPTGTGFWYLRSQPDGATAPKVKW